MKFEIERQTFNIIVSEAPFDEIDNTASCIRAGYLDVDGNPVEKDQFKPDAVAITVTDKQLVMRSLTLPNHPTATFPDRWRMLDGKPSYIKEQTNVWYIPLEPKRDPKAIAMDAKNSNIRVLDSSTTNTNIPGGKPPPQPHSSGSC